eukprot:COSAG02_NODE_43713_length_372_cov_0.901099_1_plen_23_part_10
MDPSVQLAQLEQQRQQLLDVRAR